MRKIQWIGACNGSGAQDNRTKQGPAHYFQYAESCSPHLFSKNPPFFLRESASGTRREALHGLASFNQDLAIITSESEFPVVIGGDHACAVGTWSGISRRLNGRLGLLWIDAHMDAHTMESSHSGAIHGMPVATLLGEGSAEMNALVGAQKLNPRHLVLFGIRSYEPEEKALLERYGVRVFMMDEIQKRGFSECWNEALDRVSLGTSGFGVTLDLDAIDPLEIPGVGSPVENGLKGAEIRAAMDRLPLQKNGSRWSGLEIVEFNPSLDIDNRTCEFIHDCILNVGAKLGLGSTQAA